MKDSPVEIPVDLDIASAKKKVKEAEGLFSKLGGKLENSLMQTATGTLLQLGIQVADLLATASGAASGLRVETRTVSIAEARTKKIVAEAGGDISKSEIEAIIDQSMDESRQQATGEVLAEQIAAQRKLALTEKTGELISGSLEAVWDSLSGGALK